MWKYIITGAIALLLLVGWVFMKNHEAMTMAKGEVEEVQTSYFKIIEEQQAILSNKVDKLWADQRAAYFKDRTTLYKDATEKYEAHTQTVKAQTQGLQDQINENIKKKDALVKEKDDILTRTQDIVKKVTEDVGSDLESIRQTVENLVEENIRLARNVSQKKATIDALTALEETLTVQIADANRLRLDRQARISPEDMECKVINVDPEWETITLDAGVDRGIVIGSRLAVMRGDRKICELNVTLVQTRRASCEIVYPTLLPGETVEHGDKVISVRIKK